MKLHRAAVLVSLLFASSAFAADSGEDTAAPGAPIHPSERSGWTFGISGGMGDLHVYPKHQDEQVLSGNGISLDAGRSIAQNLNVVVRAEVVDPSSATSHSIYGAGVEYFLNQRTW